MKKKLTAFLFSFVVMLQVLPVQAKQEDATLTLGNTIIQVDVSETTGRFAVSTQDGMPSKTTDRYSFLTFFNQVPETAFTTFRINGEDYIFGNDYKDEGGIVSSTVLSGSTAITVWQVNGVQVTQTLKLVTDFSDPEVGNVRIRYEVSNGSGAEVSLGSRILIDTMLGANDGSLLLAGREYITNEKELMGNDVPMVWQSMDRKMAANVSSRGVLYGWEGSRKPDQMTVAHYNTLAETKWECEVNPLLNFTTDQNEYGRADSAVALYYNPESLHAGGTVTYETYYGIGSISDVVGSDDLSIQISAPQKVALNEERDGYAVGYDPFEIMVSITNHTENTLQDVLVKLGVSENLSVIDQQDEMYVDISAGDTKDVTFYVHPSIVEKTSVEQAGIQVSHEDILSEGLKYIILPAQSGALPQVSFSEVAPSTLYTGSVNKKVTIRGTGMEILKGDNQWEMKLVDEVTGDSTSISKGDITIVDDATLTVTLPSNVDFAYKAHSHHLILQSEQYGSMHVVLEMSDDRRYEAKEYGVMYVGRTKNEDGDWIYDVAVGESEEDSIPEDFETLLTIRGTIGEYVLNDHVSYTIANGATINSAILYRNHFNQNAVITVTRYNDHVESLQDQFRDAFSGYKWYGNIHSGLILSGNGSLFVGDYQFHQGDFYIALNDECIYELRGKDDDSNNEDLNDNIGSGEIQDDYQETEDVEIITPAGVVGTQLTKTVGALTGMQVSVSNAVIGEETISLGGSISVSLPWWSNASNGDDDGDETPSPLEEKYSKRDDLNSTVGEGKKTDDLLSLNLEEMRYGVNEDDLTAQLEGVKAEGGINLTDDSLPKFTSGGAGANFEINSIDYDGWYIGVGAQVKVGDAFECEMELALVKEDTGKIYPDSLKFVASGDVVKIPLSVAGFLTRIGGGVSGLYDTIKSNFNIFPPTTLSVYTGYADPTMYTFTVDEIDMSVGGQGISFTAAEAKIIGLKIFEEVGAHLKLYGTKMEDGTVYPCVDLGYESKINILGIIRGEAGFWFVADPRLDTVFGNLSLGGKAYAGIYIPKYVPLVGGKEVMAVMAELSTYRVYTGIRVIGIPVSVSYYWTDRKVKFFDDWEYLEEEFSIPQGDIENALSVTYDTGDGNVSGVMLLGDNMTTLETTSGTQGKWNVEEVTIKDNDYSLIQVQYEDCENVLNHIRVIDPNGNKIQLKKDDNCIIQTIGADESQSGKEEHWLGIGLVSPQNGTWKIQYDIDAEVIAHEVKETSSITAGTPQLNGHTLTTDCSLQNMSDGASVDVYLVNQQEINDAVTLDEEDLSVLSEDQRNEYYAQMMSAEPAGFRITDASISVDEKTDSISVSLPDTLASGTYAVRLVVNDESGNAVTSALTDTVFTWVNPNTPSAVTNLSVLPCGDGQFRICWDPVAGADGYFVTLTDENGNEIDGVSGMAVTETTVDFGYVYHEVQYQKNPDGSFVKDEQGERVAENEPATKGVIPGRKYKAVVTAYKTVNGTDYYSDPLISDAKELPVSNPAKLSYTVNGKYPASSVRTDSNADNSQDTMMEGSFTTQVNSEEILLQMTSDQSISYLMKLDDAYITDEAGNIQEYTLEENGTTVHNLTIPEGGSNIEVIAINGAGDYTENTITVECDVTPPEVMLSDSVVFSYDGAYTVSGTAEANTRIYINGQEVPIENATFSYHGNGNETVETLTVIGVDMAGNETQLSATVMPSEFSGITDLLIAANGNIISSTDQSLTLYTGQEVQLSYYGLMANGKTILLRSDNISEQILTGSGSVQVNDHVLTGKIKGEAVLSASYPLTDSYVLENTLVVNVQNSSITPSEIQVSDTVISADAQPGTQVVHASVSHAPDSLSVQWSISDNPYLAMENDSIVLKQKMGEAVTAVITAQGSYTNDDGEVKEVSLQQQFTFTVRNDIVTVVPVDDLVVTLGTAFEDISLPEKVTVNLRDGSMADVPVTWYKGAYHSMMVGPCTIYGILQNGKEMRNTDDLRATMTIVVRKLTTQMVGEDRSQTYDGSPIDISTLFSGEIIGNPSWKITGGSGEGTLSGSLLTVSKAGTFQITMTTPESETYQSQKVTAVLTVNKADRKQPQNLVVVHPSSTVSKDGSIHGTDESMEYSMDGGKTWNPVIGNTIEGLSKGTIRIRYRENDLYLASTGVDILLTANAKATQDALQLDVVDTCVYGDDPLRLKTGGGSGNGAVHYSSSDPSIIRIEDNQAVIVSAGTAVITTYKDEDEDYNATACSKTVTVNPKQAKIRIDGKAEKTYDGNTAGITAQVVNLEEGDDCEVMLDGHKGVEAGTYIAVVTGLSNRNYVFPDTSFPYVIHPLSVSVTWNSPQTLTYTGFDQLDSLQAVYSDVSGNPVNAVLRSEERLVNVGSYEVKAESGNRNYVIASNDTLNITITKANPNIDVAVLKKDSIWNDFMKVLHLSADDLLKVSVTVTGVDLRPLTGKVELYKDETKIGEKTLVNGQCEIDLAGMKLDGTSIYASFIPDEACTNHHAAQSMKVLTQLDRKTVDTPSITAIATDDVIEVLGMTDSEAGNVQIRVNGGQWLQGTKVSGLLPGKEYVVQARYAGNDVYAPSIPSEFTVCTQYLITISPDGDSSTITSSVPLSVTYGQQSGTISAGGTWTYEKQKGEHVWISR